MFALLALAGDLGCAAGPSLVGAVSSASNDNLNTGILAAVVFPALLAIAVIVFMNSVKKNSENTLMYVRVGKERL